MLLLRLPTFQVNWYHFSDSTKSEFQKILHLTLKRSAAQTNAPDFTHSFDQPSNAEASPRFTDMLCGANSKANRNCSTPCNHRMHRKVGIKQNGKHRSNNYSPYQVVWNGHTQYGSRQTIIYILDFIQQC